MNCPNCARDNPADAAFCNGCGARLEAVCPKCRRTNAADAQFCGGCGANLTGAGAPADEAVRAYTPSHFADKILHDRAALEGERRTITVLFADAAGFTPLSERIGEEQVYTFMQGCISRMMEAVHQYEGTVTSFTGDGVMAVFGAPIAHEDSARRAVAAGLEMQALLEDYLRDPTTGNIGECHFRVGINTGPVIVGKISDDLKMDFTAIGDTVNLAQRMESMATAGAVLVSDSTHRAAGDYFDWESVGELEIKGKAAPVRAYKAVRARAAVRTRLQAAAERGLTLFVGRGEEQAMLRSSFDKAARGQGQVVFMSGEAGIGKSRLLLEFRRGLENADHRWLEGQCISYGRRIPYTPITELVKANFGVEDSDLDAAIIRRVHDGTADWDTTAAATIPYLRYLLNVDPGDPAVVSMDPMERRAGILDGLRAMLLEESKKLPLVIAVEDLHWIDENSEDALRVLVDVVATAPILVVLTYRPGYTPALGDRTFYSRFALGQLAADDSARIAEDILASDALPQQLRALITSKGEGNPFYLEEVTKSLLETGVLSRDGDGLRLERAVDQVRVPDTIQEVILSRIDRLEREARDAIQLASVIGREFTVRLLNRISDVRDRMDGLLSELKTLELIYEKAYFPELSYMFKHALTHDVAYSTLMGDRRRSLHRLVAAAIEELYPDRLPEHYETIAHHYYEAEDWEKALEYLDRSGDKARDSFANQDALHFYQQAIDVTDRLMDYRRAAEITEKRGAVQFTIGAIPDAIGDFEKMAEAGRLGGNREAEGRALAWQGEMLMWAHDMPAAEERFHEALAIGDEGFPEVRAMASFWLGCGLLIFGETDRAKPYLEEGYRTAPELGDSLTRGYCVAMNGIENNWEGRYDAALERLERGTQTLEETVITDAFGRWAQALALSGNGQYEQCLAVLHDLLAYCERVGEQMVRARALNTVAWVLGELQDHESRPRMEPPLRGGRRSPSVCRTRRSKATLDSTWVTAWPRSAGTTRPRSTT